MQRIARTTASTTARRSSCPPSTASRPIDPAALRRVDDGAIIDALNAAWAAHHPGAAPLVDFSVDDDGMLLWLSDRSAPPPATSRRTTCCTHSAPGEPRSPTRRACTRRRVPSSGLTRSTPAPRPTRSFGAQAGRPPRPRPGRIAQHGVVYTGGVKKIAEHGGDATDGPARAARRLRRRSAARRRRRARRTRPRSRRRSWPCSASIPPLCARPDRGHRRPSGGSRALNRIVGRVLRSSSGTRQYPADVLGAGTPTHGCAGAGRTPLNPRRTGWG